MALQAPTSQRLDELCSEEQLQLLNAIDSLRSQGVSHYVSLPQIIVCGDQSSGKSSVLEAISGVSFPVKSNTSTRFPTELILRKSDASSVTVSIIPHYSRSDGDKEALAAFQETLKTFDEVPTLIEKVKDAMGISTMGKAFSKDLLRIEINGPDRPHLTIVDLPGLIHSANKHQSTADIELITEVVKKYMKEARSVILAVISAKNDYANQIVLSLARRADPKGLRTLGIITKPDTLIPGSGSENMYISLARNSDVEFRLGWHALRNRDSDGDPQTLSQRDEQETAFFSKGAWSELPLSQLGIQPLRNRLSRVLLHQIATELPNLMEEIAGKAAICQQQLDKLGLPRTTVQDQRIYLIQISQGFQTLVQAAVDGTYNLAFFGDAMSTAGYERRIRAVVQNLNRDFAAELDKNGERYQLSSPKREPSTNGNTLTREQYIKKIEILLDRSRGRELPGLFSPMIVSDLFREQSSPWAEIAERHVRKVWAAARKFLGHLVNHVADVTTVEAIMMYVIVPRLDGNFKAVSAQLSKLLGPHQDGHPITYNHYMTDTLQKLRRERDESRIDTVIAKLFDTFSGEGRLRAGYSLEQVRDAFIVSGDRDMDHFAASEALDYLSAYYKVAKKRFIDDLAVEAIEGCLVAKLKDIFSPIDISRMPDNDVAQIAGETTESRQTRENLEAKLRMLSYSLETCRRFAEFKVDDLSENDERDNSSNDPAFNDVSWTEGSDDAGLKSPPPTSRDILEAVAASEDVPSLEHGSLEDVVPSKDPGDDDFWTGLSSKKDKKAKKSKKKPPPGLVLTGQTTIRTLDKHNWLPFRYCGIGFRERYIVSRRH